jgi:hypothetical protein
VAGFRANLERKLSRVAESTIVETVGVVLALVSIFLIRLVVRLVLGEDAKFFDLVPVRYVTDAGELSVLVVFFWRVLTGRVGK